MNEAFNSQLCAFAQYESLPVEELTAVLSKIVSEKVYALPTLLRLDQAKVNTSFGTSDARFLLGFIRSLPLDEAVLGAIGITDPEDVENITKSKYTGVGGLLVSFKTEDGIKNALKLDPPGSSLLWDFVERFTQQSTAPVTCKIFFGDNRI